MSDLYLYDGVPVLRNKLGIKDEKTLDLVEAEQSRRQYDDPLSARIR